MKTAERREFYSLESEMRDATRALIQAPSPVIVLDRDTVRGASLASEDIFQRPPTGLQIADVLDATTVRSLNHMRRYKQEGFLPAVAITAAGRRETCSVRCTRLTGGLYVLWLAVDKSWGQCANLSPAVRLPAPAFGYNASDEVLFHDDGTASVTHRDHDVAQVASLRAWIEGGYKPEIVVRRHLRLESS